jgi:transcriptional regulator with XRE-family HTH domain
MRARAVLAQNLRLIRRARGFTQEKLAFEAGLDRTYVSKLERRDNSGSVDTLEAIANVLEVKLRQLVDEDFTLEGAGIEPVPIRRKPRRR